MSVVYRLTSPSGKSYIGMSKFTAERRFKKHCFDAANKRNTALCAAIRKHGAGAMKVETLLIGETGFCLEMEQRLIAGMGTMHPHGYNLTAGGEGVMEMCEEVAAKHKASMNRPENVARKSAASKEYANRPETKAATGELMRKRWEDPAYREAFAEKMKKATDAGVFKDKPRTEMNCAHCGSVFSGIAGAIYCCGNCKSRAFYRRKTAPRASKRI